VRPASRLAKLGSVGHVKPVTTSQFIVFGGFEIIGLIVIARMWMKRWHRYLSVRLIWSTVLLVPVFGLLFYFFLRTSPGEHPYDTDTMQGSAESMGAGSGGHH